MKDLIRKILKEETKGQSLMNKITKYNSLLPTEKPKIIDKRTNETTADDLFWTLVDDVDYKSDDDYRRVKKFIMDLFTYGGWDKKKCNLLQALLGAKQGALEKAHGDKIKNVSDDSWNDLTSDIVSRGKDFFLKALDDYDMVQTMANNNDYSESFAYAFPYDFDLE